MQMVSLGWCALVFLVGVRFLPDLCRLVPRMLNPQCYRCAFCAPIGSHDIRVGCSNREASVEVHPVVKANTLFDWPNAFDPIYIVACSGYTDSEMQSTSFKQQQTNKQKET